MENEENKKFEEKLKVLKIKVKQLSQSYNKVKRVYRNNYALMKYNTQIGEMIEKIESMIFNFNFYNYENLSSILD